jgi:hypothetical protein
MGIVNPDEKKEDLAIDCTRDEECKESTHFHIDPAEYQINSDVKIQIEIEKARQHKIF